MAKTDHSLAFSLHPFAFPDALACCKRKSVTILGLTLRLPKLTLRLPKRPACFLSQGFSPLLDGGSRALDPMAKIFDQNVARAQVRLHDGGTIKLAQGAAEPQTVKAGKNADDMGGMLKYNYLGPAMLSINSQP